MAARERNRQQRVMAFMARDGDGQLSHGKRRGEIYRTEGTLSSRYGMKIHYQKRKNTAVKQIFVGSRGGKRHTI